jgi:hemerythrin-like metal-binding protein
MAFFNWTDNLSVGIKALDDDHTKLVEIINSLYEAMKSGQGKEALGKTFDQLIRYTQFHFAREEDFFAKTAYPEAAAHIKEHQNLVAQARTLQTRQKSGEIALTVETLDFLRDWLGHHILETDKQYSHHLNASGVV